MRLALRFVLCLTAVIALVCSQASAQGLEEYRFFLSGSAGIAQPNTDAFSNPITFTLFAEAGNFEADYVLDSGPVYDGGVTVRLWRNLGAGVNVSKSRTTDTAAIEASLPHPFFFGQHRQLTGTAPGLRHEEVAVHLHGAFIWMRGWAVISGFGGPTFFNFKQDLVQSIRHAEVGFPFDAVTFIGHGATRVSESKVGFHAGADAAFYLASSGVWEHVGVGALVRYSRAEVDVSAGRGDSVTLELGGLQFAGGIRVRF